MARILTPQEVVDEFGKGIDEMLSLAQPESVERTITGATPLDAHTAAQAQSDIRRIHGGRIGFNAIVYNMTSTTDGCTITLSRHQGY